MNNSCLKQIFRAFEMMNRCYDGPEDTGAGGGGGEGEGEGAGEAGEDLFKDTNIPLEVQDDPALIEMRRAEIAEEAANKGKGEAGEGGGEGKPFEKDVELNYKEKDDSEAKTVVVDKANDDGTYNITVDGKVIENVKKEMLSAIELKYEKDIELVYKEKEDSEGEDAVVDKVNEDGSYNIKVGDKVIENVKIENLAKPEEATYTYENDVTIEGMTFKKEVLQKTPTEVLENLGSLINKNKELTEQIDTLGTANNEFFEDPVIKQRMKRLEEGKGDVAYATYGMSKETRKLLEETLELKPEEIVDINKEFEKDMVDNVNLAVKDILIKNKIENDTKEQAEKGMKVLLGFGEINPEFKIEETNIEKLWTQKEKHSEWNKFIKNTGRYQKHLIEKMGFKRYSDLAIYKPKTLYAMVATDLGEPVAFNTTERDKKIRQTERDKVLAIFNPKELTRGSKPMKSKSAPETTKKKTSVIDDSPIDKSKFEDENYVASLYEAAKSDEEIFKIQDMVKESLGNKK